MPPNTRAVPTQWVRLKGFWKYQMEKRRLRNFLQVRTSVAVRLGHSAVSTNTADMQRYWGMTLPTSWSSIVGIGGRKGRTDMGVEAKQMFQCLG